MPIPVKRGASGLIDGHLNLGWRTTHVHGGFAIIGFQGNALENISGFVVDCAATGGAPNTADLQHFEVLFSSTTADAGSFGDGLNETCMQQRGLQRFPLSSPVQARYVQLQVIGNYGDAKLTGVAEFEALAQPALAGERAPASTVRTPLVAHVVTGEAPQLLGKVTQIVSGLGVQPPNQQTQQGKVQEPVFNQYGLSTKAAQRASMQFVDGTMLYLSQDTDAVLRSPTVTYVKNGIAEQKLQPGTTHVVSTAEASAAAIGTDFVVDTTPRHMSLFVIEGAVLVHNKFGSQVVKTGQYTTVVKGHTPATPQPISSSRTPHPNTWSLSMIDPHLPINVALDANGGYIVSSSG